jgi:hypothetical protein
MRLRISSGVTRRADISIAPGTTATRYPIGRQPIRNRSFSQISRCFHAHCSTLAQFTAKDSARLRVNRTLLCKKKRPQDGKPEAVELRVYGINSADV